jgi:hypothetical protein
LTENSSHCPSCGTPVAAGTLRRFDGVCRRCHKQPIGLRKQWVFFGLLAICAPVAAFLVDQELAALEASGGTRSVHVMIAVCYRLAGRLGVAAVFSVAGLIFATLAFRSFRDARLSKTRISAIKNENEIQ